MATWQEIEMDAADFAARVRARFDIGTNKTIATLRQDGAPRISASELEFAGPHHKLGRLCGVHLANRGDKPGAAFRFVSPVGDRSPGLSPRLATG
jgi:hypothetical protein